MSDQTFPPALRKIFEQVHESGDQVALISAEIPPGWELGTETAFTGDDWTAGRVPANRDMVLFLGQLPHLAAARAAQIPGRLAKLVRPGGLLFLTARTTDHATWIQPEPGWVRSGSRELAHARTGASRFFFHDDEIVTLFAAWNILHHTESEDGCIEIVLMKPEGRTVDVSTALYEG